MQVQIVDPEFENWIWKELRFAGTVNFPEMQIHSFYEIPSPLPKKRKLTSTSAVPYMPFSYGNGYFDLDKNIKCQLQLAEW